MCSRSNTRHPKIRNRAKSRKLFRPISMMVQVFEQNVIPNDHGRHSGLPEEKSDAMSNPFLGKSFHTGEAGVSNSMIR